MKRTPESDYLREWLEETEGDPADPVEGTRRAMSNLDQTRQASRWWPFPVFYRGAGTTAHQPAITDTTEHRPDPIPAMNGRSPNVSGRTQSMLSPAKAITAGAIVLAIGGVMLIAQPFQQWSVAPGAQVQPPAAPTAFSSTYSWSGRSNTGTTMETDDGTIVSDGVGWMFNNRESSDPRFAGPLVLTYTEIEFPDLGGSMSVGGYRIETDEGAWQQVPTASVSYEEDYAQWASGHIPPADNIQFWTFIGEGDYEGLTAVVQETHWPGGAEGIYQFDGYILEGGLWDAPEPWVP